MKEYLDKFDRVILWFVIFFWLIVWFLRTEEPTPYIDASVTISQSEEPKQENDTLEKVWTVFAEQKKPTTEKKIEVMTKYWYEEVEAEYIIQYCSTVKNPNNCVELATGIAYHETKIWNVGVGRGHKNNLYWLTHSYYNPETWGRATRMRSYPNRMASFEDRVQRYDQYWYSNDCVEMISKSRYTTTQTEAWIDTCERVRFEFYR